MNPDLDTREQLSAQLKLDFYIQDEKAREYLLDFVHDLSRDPLSRTKELIVFRGIPRSGKTTLVRKVRGVLGNTVCRQWNTAIRREHFECLNAPLAIIDYNVHRPINAALIREALSDDRFVIGGSPGQVPTCNIIAVSSNPYLIDQANRKGQVIDFIPRDIPEMIETRDALRPKLVPGLLPDLADIVCSFYGPD